MKISMYSDVWISEDLDLHEEKSGGPCLSTWDSTVAVNSFLKCSSVRPSSKRGIFEETVPLADEALNIIINRKARIRASLVFSVVNLVVNRL